MRRRRYQKGSLQERRHGKKRVWVVQYYDAEGHHRYHTLGRMADLTKSQAEQSAVPLLQNPNDLFFAVARSTHTSFSFPDQQSRFVAEHEIL
jgi:hypothetical protein